MKKLLALALALILTLSLCACGGGSAAPTADAAPAQPASEGSPEAPAADAAPAQPASEAPPEAPSGEEAPAEAPASTETFDVSIQFTFPEESAAGAQAVLDAIEQESGGRINFEVYYSYSFVDNADVVDALETNQLNIAGLMPSEYSCFALNGRLCSLPLLNYPNWEAACKIWLNMVYGTPEMMAEYTDNGMVFWGGYMCPGYQFYSSKDITDTTPAAFNGLTVMCDNAEMQSFINSNQGGAISVFPPDYLSNLQNGVADALVQHANCAYVFGCFDYTKTAIFFGDGGFYNLPLAYCFSQSFWDSLPADLQEIFASHAAELCRASYESDNGLYSNVAMPDLESKAKIITLDDEQIAAWQTAISGIVDSSIAEISKDSASAQQVYDKLKSVIADYDEASFTIGTNNFGKEAQW